MSVVAYTNACLCPSLSRSLVLSLSLVLYVHNHIYVKMLIEERDRETTHHAHVSSFECCDTAKLVSLKTCCLVNWSQAH